MGKTYKDNRDKWKHKVKKNNGKKKFGGKPKDHHDGNDSHTSSDHTPNYPAFDYTSYLWFNWHGSPMAEATDFFTQRIGNCPLKKIC